MTTDEIITIAYPDTPVYVGRPERMLEDERARMHLHPHFELMWVSKGSPTYFCDFSHYETTPGTLVFISPGQLHDWATPWQPNHLTVLGFQADALPEMGLERVGLPFFDIDAFPLITLTAGDAALFQSLFDLALQRFRAVGVSDQSLLLSYVKTILLESRRLYAAVDDRPVTQSSTLVKALQQAIENQYLQRWKVQQYADRLGVTPNHLTKVVRATLHTTPRRLISQRLLLEVKRRLVHSDATLESISFELAFKSPSQFGHWFKKQTGHSPSHFRQQYR